MAVGHHGPSSTGRGAFQTHVLYFTNKTPESEAYVLFL